MKIKFWGIRGSLPTPGKETIKYGGNTTCVEIRLNSGTLIIIDAGSGLKKLGDQILKDSSVSEMYLFLTHSHWDHMMGFPFFTPAYLSKYKIFVRGFADAKGTLKKYLAHQMEPPYFPVSFNVLKAQFDFSNSAPAKKQYIDQAEITPIPLNHPNGGFGFKITEDGKTFVFLTDNELDYHHEGGPGRDDFIEFSHHADLLVHDAQYTDEEYSKLTRGWGHSTLRDAVGLALEAKPALFGLAHHDPNHSDEMIDGFVDQCNQWISKKSGAFDCFAVQEGMEINL